MNKRACQEFERIPFKKYINWRINLTRLLRDYHAQRLYSRGLPGIEGIELTNHCIYNCIMCLRSTNMTRQKGFMEYALFKKIIDQVAFYNRCIIFAMYGEPLLHPELERLIRYVKENHIAVRLATNAVILNEENTYKILRSAPDYVVVSLDATDDAVLKKIRGENADYKKSEENLTYFIRRKNQTRSRWPFLHVRMIEMELNKHQTEEFKKKWSVEGVDKCDIRKMGLMVDTAHVRSLSPDKNFVVKPGPCIRPWRFVTVLNNGLVVPCCHDYDAKYVLGDLKFQTLKEIWNSQKVVQLRRQFVENDYSKTGFVCERCYTKKILSIRKYYPFY